MIVTGIAGLQDRDYEVHPISPTANLDGGNADTVITFTNARAARLSMQGNRI